MAMTYEYWTTKDDDDFVVRLKVVSFYASDPEEYSWRQETEWEAEEDTGFMTEAQIASMEEWLFNEHSEYLADLDYFD